jgi:hypothetical protein
LIQRAEPHHVAHQHRGARLGVAVQIAFVEKQNFEKPEYRISGGSRVGNQALSSYGFCVLFYYKIFLLPMEKDELRL